MLRRSGSIAGLLLIAGLASAQTPSASAEAVSVAETWGTAAGHSTLMAYEFVPEYTCCIEKLHGATYCPSDIENDDPMYVEGHLEVPDGAMLSQFQIWAYDTDPVNGLTVELYEVCQAPGFNAPTTTLVTSIDTFGSAGTYFGFKPLNGRRVRSDCTYDFRVAFNPIPACKGTALQLQKVALVWVRDVAPGPGTATFSDVSPGHPFFRYVEALAGSGVTGGCGSNNYCPEAPLTRAQMATFLSRALGLEWP